MEISVEKNILTITIDEETRQELLSMEYFEMLDSDEDEFSQRFNEELESLTCNSEFSYCEDISYFGHFSQSEAFYIPTEDGEGAEELYYNRYYALKDWRVELVKNGKYKFQLG